MIRYFLSILIVSLTLLNSSILHDKVKNIIGGDKYQTHKGLINLILKDEKKFLDNEKIKYYKLLETLQSNGLLDLRLDKPKEITIEFKILSKNIKSYKILNDTLHAIGYRYFFTKSMNLNENKELIWNIRFKAEYMLDPVVLLKELMLHNCKVISVVSKTNEHWYYEIDFNNSKIVEATKIEKNERVKFQKPLRAFFLRVDDAKSLQVISRNLNNWFPHIVFFDKDLTVLNVIKKNRIYKGFTTKVPKSTKYIKITDLYNLINIKRGLTLIVR